MKTRIATVAATLMLLLGGAGPASAFGPYEQCMSSAGCVFYDGAWHCWNPDAYSLCAPD